MSKLGTLLERILQFKRIRSQVEYLIYENRRMRSLMREHGIADPSRVKETEDAFEYQWTNLPTGKRLATDPEFRRGVMKELSNILLKPMGWFNTKEVLDAGCGNGRYTLGFCELGARVDAFDKSPMGVKMTKELCKQYPNMGEVICADVLDIDLEGCYGEYDLVYCYGLIHHTPNPRLAVKNLAKYVKPGGYLFLMVYGEPRLDEAADFSELSRYERWRQDTKGLPFSEKIAYLKQEVDPEYLHSSFDATAPSINELFTFAELKSWLVQDGFTDIKKTQSSRNHHIVARKLC